MLAQCAATAAAAATGGADDAAASRPALIAVTLDLEMSRNFPRWEDVHWDYEKGNLTPEVKAYTREACRRVKDRGGVVHAFVVGRVLEQEDVSWLREIAEEGHPLGNHTYDHVNVLAKDVPSLQFRFQRSPWLLDGLTVPEAIRANVDRTSRAMRDRVGASPDGFRTPGGFAEGLAGREDLQKMFLDLGFRWISSRYPPHGGLEDLHGTDRRPSREAFESILAAQALAQPTTYPTGLVEVPMSPISDIGAFRNGRWKLDYFLESIRACVELAIERRACFDFLAHPSCLGVVDPDFRTIDMICDLVEQSKGSARIVGLGEFVERAATRRAAGR